MRLMWRLLLCPPSNIFARGASAFPLHLSKLDSRILLSSIVPVVAGLLYSLKTTAILSILNKFSYNSLYY